VLDYIPITGDDESKMLKTLGVKTVEDLFNISIPEEIRFKRRLDIPEGISEYELIKLLKAISEENYSLDDYVSFLGAGAYDHFIPSIVDTIISLPEFYTPYTPYQPEASQGILQSLFEYQTMISELTSLEVANASLYDGSTAVSEAALLALDVTGRNRVVISEAVHPEYRDVLINYTRGLGVEVVTTPIKGGLTDVSSLKSAMNAETACVIIQQPNFLGYIEDVHKIADIVSNYPSIYIASVDPISLGVLKAPGDYGVEVAVGEGQALGNNISYGGPFLGIFACRKEYLRRVPGRLVSATTDGKGNTGYVLTLQTREQHIRREKATSNITTSEVLNAIAATVYLSYMGQAGLKEVANQCLQKARYAYERLVSIDYLEPISNAPFFKEFALKSSKSVSEINDFLLTEGIIGGLDLGRFYPELKDTFLFCVTEKRTKEEIDNLAELLRSV